MENNPQIFFSSPLVWTQAATLDMDYAIMPVSLQENSSQDHYGCILSGESGLLFMLIVLLEGSCLKIRICKCGYRTALFSKDGEWGWGRKKHLV